MSLYAFMTYVDIQVFARKMCNLPFSLYLYYILHLNQSSLKSSRQKNKITPMLYLEYNC